MKSIEKFGAGKTADPENTNKKDLSLLPGAEPVLDKGSGRREKMKNSGSGSGYNVIVHHRFRKDTFKNGIAYFTKITLISTKNSFNWMLIQNFFVFSFDRIRF